MTSRSDKFSNVIIVLVWQCLLLSFLGLVGIRSNSILMWTFISVFIFLLVWTLLLVILAKRREQSFGLSFVARKQHYIQASVQIAIFTYWGWYWTPVYEHFWLILAQLLFAYSFDALLHWSRGRTYVLGFGPFPIILSINLFLWFKQDWFYFQFVMIAVGFLGKEFIRWQREGRSSHIFNPSAFALGLFSLLLILTKTTNLTWGPEIASTLTLAPNIYLFLFVMGLVVMYFFSITLVAMSAAATLFALSALYSSLSGVPYFLDSEIPAAVFLGLHFLITDPSTSPRSLLGKTFFGVLYGIGVFALYALLSMLGAPTFYDKLLCVPLLNLAVIGIDRVSNLLLTKFSWRPVKQLGRVNLSYMVVWIVLFSVMSSVDKTDGFHVGDSLPFWQHSCAENRANACERLLLLEGTYCGDKSAWACNELAIHYREGFLIPKNPIIASELFSQSCQLRFYAACQNLLDPTAMVKASPKTLDLRLLLRQGGENLMTLDEPALLARACQHGWFFACAIE